jgi:hypothetical protein
MLYCAVWRALYKVEGSSKLCWCTQIGPKVPGAMCQASKLCCIYHHRLPYFGCRLLKVLHCYMLCPVELKGHIFKQVGGWLCRHELLKPTQDSDQVMQQC